MAAKVRYICWKESLLPSIGVMDVPCSSFDIQLLLCPVYRLDCVIYLDFLVVFKDVCFLLNTGGPSKEKQNISLHQFSLSISVTFYRKSIGVTKSVDWNCPLMVR